MCIIGLGEIIKKAVPVDRSNYEKDIRYILQAGLC